MSAGDVVPVELFVAVVEALHAAECELGQLDGMELEIPEADKVVALLREHKAMQGTLRAAPEDWKQALRANYELAIKTVSVEPLDGPVVPAMPEVRAQVAGVWELLRRAALTDPGVDAALRRAVIHG